MLDFVSKSQSFDARIIENRLTVRKSVMTSLCFPFSMQAMWAYIKETRYDQKWRQKLCKYRVIRVCLS